MTIPLKIQLTDGTESVLFAVGAAIVWTADEQGFPYLVRLIRSDEQVILADGEKVFPIYAPQELLR